MNQLENQSNDSAETANLRALADALYREKVRAARLRSPSDKLSDGPRLFDLGVELSKSGIRALHPDWDEERVMAEVRRRLEINRRLNSESSCEHEFSLG